MTWRYIFGAVMGGVSGAVLFFLIKIENWWQFLIVLLVWLAVLAVVGRYFNANKQRGSARDLALILASAAACVILLVLLEDSLWRNSMIVFAGLIMVFLFSQLARRASGLSYEEKPYRRIRMMLWVFVAYAVLTLVYALGSFFPSVPFWLASLAGSAIVGAISLLIWQMYFAVSWRSLLLWSLIVALSVWEIIWAQNFLPFGYLALGAFTAWVWYIMQLFARFHLSQPGIIWRRQVYFLMTNLVLYVLMLWVFVRWI
ncbi:MAG: hypothetical protein HZC26_00375 [Candidatus Magasanikbacteria bacterium]|nr:hypothetical protein [Candidatus Magasanikbacteria bacterium]